MSSDIRNHYRFDPAGPAVQPVAASGTIRCQLLCFEADQAYRAGEQAACLCYVVEGTALFTLGERQEHVSAGGVIPVQPGDPLEIGNPGPRRLVVMTVTGEFGDATGNP